MVIRVLIILVLLYSCKSENKNTTGIREEYFYKINYVDTSRVEYAVRRYQFNGDTIKLEIKRFSELGEVISNTGGGGIFLMDGENMRMLKNQILGDVVYSVKKKDSCWTYFHPYYHRMDNCYKGLTKDGKGFVFSSSQQAADGINRILYFDKNYALIKETSDSPIENFREEIRINKSEVPNNVLESIDFLNNL